MIIRLEQGYESRVYVAASCSSVSLSTTYTRLYTLQICVLTGWLQYSRMHAVQNKAHLWRLPVISAAVAHFSHAYPACLAAPRLHHLSARRRQTQLKAHVCLCSLA